MGQDRSATDLRPVRSLCRSVVRGTMSNKAHAREDDAVVSVKSQHSTAWPPPSPFSHLPHPSDSQQVEPHGKISDPTIVLERPDLAEEHADGHPNDQPDHETELAHRDLAERLSVAKNEGTNIDNKLNTLKDSADVAHVSATNSFSNVGVGVNWVLVTVELAVQVGKDASGVECDETHLQIE